MYAHYGRKGCFFFRNIEQRLFCVYDFALKLVLDNYVKKIEIKDTYVITSEEKEQKRIIR